MAGPFAVVRGWRGGVEMAAQPLPERPFTAGLDDAGQFGEDPLPINFRRRGHDIQRSPHQRQQGGRLAAELTQLGQARQVVAQQQRALPVIDAQRGSGVDRQADAEPETRQRSRLPRAKTQQRQRCPGRVLGQQQTLMLKRRSGDGAAAQFGQRRQVGRGGVADL